MYIANKLISSDTPITSYFNPGSVPSTAFDTYKSGLQSE
jgi:hypothetical protein